MDVRRGWCLNIQRMNREFPLYALIVFLVVSSTGYAQVTCRSDVSYLWHRKNLEITTPTPPDPSGTPAAGIERETTVPWIRLERVGTTEEEAKGALDIVLSREKSKAYAQCQKDHEELATCIATAHETMSAVIGSSSYSARKAIEDAIESDCKARQGLCIEAVASEIKCELPPTPTPSAAESSKDAKGKKK